MKVITLRNRFVNSWTVVDLIALEDRNLFEESRKNAGSYQPRDASTDYNGILAYATH